MKKEILDARINRVLISIRLVVFGVAIWLLYKLAIAMQHFINSLVTLTDLVMNNNPSNEIKFLYWGFGVYLLCLMVRTIVIILQAIYDRTYSWKPSKKYYNYMLNNWGVYK